MGEVQLESMLERGGDGIETAMSENVEVVVMAGSYKHGCWKSQKEKIQSQKEKKQNKIK
jgi:hypothetical protein